MPSDAQIVSSLKLAQSRSDAKTEAGNPRRISDTKSNSVFGEPTILAPPRYWRTAKNLPS